MAVDLDHSFTTSKSADDMYAAVCDLERVVRVSFAFLLDREPASSIMREFSLDVIQRYFPEYEDELPRRLA